jgi:hypothetical protein
VTLTKRVTVATAVTKSHLSLARALGASLRRHHPDTDFVVLLVDEPEGYVTPATEPFRIVSISELDLPRRERFLFQYTRMQAVSAAKPFLLARLLSEALPAVAFLDPDVLILGSLAPLFDQVSLHPIVLTPHLDVGLAGDDRAARELNILVSGVYNGGVVGVSNTPDALDFLEWWRDRLWSYCRFAVDDGMHYDQRWLDLVPGLFDGVEIFRDPRYNIAHWNLPERSAVPCHLFHFSGYVPEEPEQVTKYSRRLGMGDVGDTALLFERYRNALVEAGYEETRHWPYAYDSFDNGVPIPDLVRTIYRDLGEEVARFGDPFRTGSSDSFYCWLNEPIDRARARHRVSRLWTEAHRRRPELQQLFPDPLGADRRSFLAWTTAHGRDEHNVPDELGTPA